ASPGVSFSPGFLATILATGLMICGATIGLTALASTLAAWAFLPFTSGSGFALAAGLACACFTATDFAGLAACFTGLAGLDGFAAGLADFFTAAVFAEAGLAAGFFAGLAADLAAFLLRTGLLTKASLSYAPYNRSA